jgi:beta-galactosidase
MDRREFLGALAATPATATGPRLRENFNRGWLFARQSQGTGALGSFDRQNEAAARIEPRFRDARTPGYDDANWAAINLPHTWNAYDSMDEAPGYWRGIGWYRKHFKLADQHSGKAVFLEFEGASSVAEFWLNGTRIGEHKGGYTGFELDVTDDVKFGNVDNVLTVKVDNLFRDTVPPTVKTDYTFYGGIYRDVWLRIFEPSYVSDVVWFTPRVDEQAAELRLRSLVANKARQAVGLTLVQEVFDPQGILAKTFSTAIRVPPGKTQEVMQDGGRVANPLLWSPDSPHLYHIRTTLLEGSRPMDMVENPLGFRWFKFDAQQGFFLNGKRVQLQGTNWHQSYPGMGDALPNSRHVKDMEIIRAMGVNFWRTSHYPHDPATMEASDRLGLMVWEELPINKEIGSPPEYVANCLAMANEMIRRDRNHPSVIVWGIAGELNAPVSVAKKVIAAVAKRYRELDSSRPVAMHEPGGGGAGSAGGRGGAGRGQRDR